MGRFRQRGKKGRPQALALSLTAALFCGWPLTQAVAQVGGGAGPSLLPTNGPSLLPPEYQVLLNLEEGYTSNAGGSPGAGQGDEFTRLNLNFGYLFDSSRLTADAHYMFTGDYYVDHHNLDQIQNHLNLFAKGIVVPDTLQVLFAGFASPLNISRLGAVSAGPESASNSNVRNVYGYNIEPDYHVRFKDYADSDLVVKQGGVFFTSTGLGNTGTSSPTAPPNNALSTNVTEELKSGTYFDRIKWKIEGFDTESSQTTQSESQRQGTAQITYELTRSLGIVGTGGYGTFSASIPLNKDLDGPIGMGGFEVTTGPTFHLIAQAGTQNNFFSYTGSLNWQLGAFTTVVGSATDQLMTPADELLGNLAQLATTLNGDFFNPETQAPGSDLFDQSPDSNFTPPESFGGLGLDNSIYRMRQYALSVAEIDERMSYQFEVLGNVRDRLNIIANQPDTRTSLFGVLAAVRRKIWPNLEGGLSAEYSTAEEYGGNDQLANGSANLTYLLSENMEVFFIGRYLRRLSANQSAAVGGYPLTDIQAIVGITRRL